MLAFNRTFCLIEQLSALPVLRWQCFGEVSTWPAHQAETLICMADLA